MSRESAAEEIYDAAAITEMPRWSTGDVDRARTDIKRKRAQDRQSGRVCCCKSGRTCREFKDLIAGALATVAGFALGVVVKKIIDLDTKLDADDRTEACDTWCRVGSVVWYGVFGLGFYFFVVYWLFRKVDAAERAHSAMREWSEEQVSEWISLLELPDGCAEAVRELFSDVDGEELLELTPKPLQKMLRLVGVAEPVPVAEAILRQRRAQEMKKDLPKPLSRSEQRREEEKARELMRSVSYKFETGVLTTMIKKLTSTQMMTLAVLVHRIRNDNLPASHSDAVHEAWESLAWMYCGCVVCMILMHEVPARIAARFRLSIDLARLDRVVDVANKSGLAWLLAVGAIESIEISAVHTWQGANLQNVHYFSGAYHGVPILCRFCICAGTFVLACVVLFVLQRISRRCDPTSRWCCRGYHGGQDKYLRDLRAPGRGSVRIDRSELDWSTAHFTGLHGHRLLQQLEQAVTTISALALQRFVMSLVTPNAWSTSDDALGGQSAAGAVETVVTEVTQAISSPPPPEPAPEPVEGSWSGSYDDGSFDGGSVVENVTETLSPLLAVCQRALATNNVTELNSALRSTSAGLQVNDASGTHLVSRLEPEPGPEPEPEPMPEPEPLEVHEYGVVTQLKDESWTCGGASAKHDLVCSVFPKWAEPLGNNSAESPWALGGCLEEGALQMRADAADAPWGGAFCDADGAASTFCTGAMRKEACSETHPGGCCGEKPLYGDPILQVLYAVLWTVLAWWLLVWIEKKLRNRLERVLDAMDGGGGVAHSSEDNPVGEDRAMLLDDDTSGGKASGTAVRCGRDSKAWYDFWCMLATVVSSFSAWIVNKTWWDVVLNILKWMEVYEHYYVNALVLTVLAEVTRRTLTDSKKEVLPSTRPAGRPLSSTYSPVTLEPAGAAPGPDGQGEKVAIAGSI